MFVKIAIKLTIRNLDGIRHSIGITFVSQYFSSLSWLQ